MNQEKQERIKACLQELSTLLYEEADKSKLIDLEGIEKTVCSQVLELVSPEIALFLSNKKLEQSFGKTRKIKSLVGELTLKAKQLQRLGLKARSRLSPLLQKCCLRLSANESYQKAEIEIEALTGVKVGHSTQQKLVLSQDFQLPLALQAVSEVSVDGGKIRLRGQAKAGCHWRDYKTVRLQGIYYGAFFDDNQSLVDYVNSQRLVNPLVCLGDGHDGVWNLVREFGKPENFERWEILDWYHLKENLYKIGGSLKRLKAAENFLWQGQIDNTQALFIHCRGKQVKNFITYLNKHRSRIVNYSYYQAEELCSIGSGAVESAIKQIGARIKISGAQWNVESVNQILSVRCAYLNGLLAI
ncbi:ISKra4 family transposase [Nostoc sp. JL23]|uniref:ISKra4 family transposase n=1 Tax=Nostoc sp. JL23 TaxID=2815394 RepID=UPI001D634130|nr:ISKra4 family transposase [Nostoc sp. JL23]MBN3878699.1 ISKra4 family transposase [Nostoc sp. JL23]